MKIEKTNIEGCFILEPRVFQDERGWFFESFNTKTFREATGAEVDFVQDNQSFSSYGVIRALHAQEGEFAQAKLVSVLQGDVLDVAVDARPGSPTFGQHVAVKLNGVNKKQLFIPRGCLHGFSVLSKTAHFYYKCDNFYNKESEKGVVYNDPNLNIDWMVPEADRVLSAKDKVLPLLNEIV